MAIEKEIVYPDMQIKSIYFYRVLLFCLVLFPIYQDSPLGLFLGAMGYSIIMPLSLILFFTYIVAKKKLPNNKFLMPLYLLGIWLFIISFIAILIWCLLGNPITVVSEFLPFKAIKVCIQYLSYPAYIALILISCRKVGTPYIGKYSYYTLMILTIICFIEMHQIPYAFEFIHFNGVFPYGRIRLLTTESSWTAMMIYVYSFLSLLWALSNRKKMTIIIIFAFIAFLFTTTGSRSLMLSIVLTIGIYILFAFKKLNRRTIFTLLGLMVILIIFIQIFLPKLSSSFRIDIERFTSLATRSYTGGLGLLIGIVFPLGVGGAVYLGVFRNALIHFLWIFDKLPLKLNTNEIMNLISQSSDVALSVKSGILHYNMYWGILGTLYLMYAFYKLTKAILKLNVRFKELLLTVFWTAVLLIIFASNFSFEFWLLYAFLINIEENKSRVENA